MPKRIVRETIYPEKGIGQRLGTFVLVCGGIVALVFTVVTTQRLSDDTLALIIGLVLAGVPLLAIIAGMVYLFLRWQLRQAERPRQAPQPMMTPPIILQVPQPQQQAYPALTGRGGEYVDVPPDRRWDVIGDDG